MTECLIIGGGVIGLSLAWQLAMRGRKVRVLDRQQVGREASWAGAGILPPASREALAHPLDQLRGMSFELHREWAERLRVETGIDTGYRRCGGIYLARSAGEAAALAAWAASLREEGVAVERLGLGVGERESGRVGDKEIRTHGEGSSLSLSPTLPLAPSEEALSVWLSIQASSAPKNIAPNATTPSQGLLSKGLTQLRQELRQTSEILLKSLVQVEPNVVIQPPGGSLPIRSAWLLPDECQLRNPHYLQALTRVCELQGVALSPEVEVQDFRLSDGAIQAVITSDGVITADQICVTSGAWTGQLLQKLGMTIGVVPIRGQMVLFRCERPPATCVINEGPRYIVPREDGHLLVGSTEEEAGFDKRTTEVAIAELIEFARSLLPVLNEAEVKQTWAGLRPGSFDGFPYLGAIPGLTNAFVAAGHYRSGLYLSPGTATVMAELMCGAATSLDLSVFRVGR
jgi:glycine/D-amino acid oxidase-like deaminating enzyme